jgi:hypothetical protein
MFLERIFTASKAVFSRRAHNHDQNAEARVILQRVRELMELASPTPIAPCSGEATVDLESAGGSIVGTNTYGERTYAEDPH